MTQLAQERDVEQADGPGWGSARNVLRDTLAVQQRLAGSSLARVEMFSVPDPYGLNAAEQALADQLIAELEAEVNDATLDEPGVSALLDEQRFPSLVPWMGMRGSALALHTVYRAGTVDRCAWQLPPEVFTSSQFGARSAVDVLEEKVGAATAARIHARHEAFLAAPLLAASRLVLAGCADCRAVRARAALAASLIEARFQARTSPVRLASVACGAAGPIAETARALTERGVPVEGLALLDRDPMALAAGGHIARQALGGVDPELLLVDLIDGARRRAVDLTPYCAPGWDVVDILGLFEYLPASLAVDLVRNAIAACRPGGIVVVANMLDERPQQAFFSKVIQWPAVIQRSPAELLGLLESAGVTREQVALVASPDAPVYAVAAIYV